MSAPVYDKAKAFDAFISIAQFQFRIWNVTRELFLKNPRNLASVNATRNDIMNKLAGSVFQSLSDACVQAVYSGLAALLDAKCSQTNEAKANLVLQRVIDDVGPPAGTPARAEVEKDLNELQDLAQPITNGRSKVGAHSDLMTALAILAHDEDGTPYPLQRLNGADLERIMKLLAGIIDALIQHVRPGFEWRPDGMEDEIDELFETLSLGLKTMRKKSI